MKQRNCEVHRCGACREEIYGHYRLYPLKSIGEYYNEGSCGSSDSCMLFIAISKFYHPSTLSLSIRSIVYQARLTVDRWIHRYVMVYTSMGNTVNLFFLLIVAVFHFAPTLDPNHGPFSCFLLLFIVTDPLTRFSDHTYPFFIFFSSISLHFLYTFPLSLPFIFQQQCLGKKWVLSISSSSSLSLNPQSS